MWPPVALCIVFAYGVVAAACSAWFAWGIAPRIDPAAAGSGSAFRVVLFASGLVLWPIQIVIVWKNFRKSET